VLEFLILVLYEFVSCSRNARAQAKVVCMQLYTTFWIHAPMNSNESMDCLALVLFSCAVSITIDVHSLHLQVMSLVGKVSIIVIGTASSMTFTTMPLHLLLVHWSLMYHSL
jgi:hypothetical protein